MKYFEKNKKHITEISINNKVKKDKNYYYEMD